MNENYIRSIHLHSEANEGYLHRLPVVRHLSDKRELPFTKPVTFLVGENGTGKSTLLEAIAVAYGFNAEGGSKNFRFTTADTHSSLHEHMALTRGILRPEDGFFLRAESFYNTASYIDRIYEDEFKSKLRTSYGASSLHKQSHGESFLALVEHRFSGNGLYLLDEPEAALSPNRLLTLLVRIHELVQQNSQFIIATHSPILMAYPNAMLYHLTAEGISETCYQDTEHYQLTKQFMENPEQMLYYLLNQKQDELE